MADWVELATQLTQVVAAVFGRGVVHRDINPGNVLVHGGSARPMLIDFDLASTFTEQRPGFTHHRELTGTLQYLAPEQTGRTGWQVDHRADLYALGVTLYQAATGVLPFDDEDPLRLIHAHLTQVPQPACTVNPAFPQELSAVVAHLLEKDPGRRYQSAQGLLHDLAGPARSPDPRAARAFRPGERDFPARLTAPTQLLGRSAQIALLGDALADAVAGRRRGLLVSGGPGVGKSALVDELRPRVATAGGWLVRGKSDQYRQDPDSSSARQALRGIGRLLLAESESQVAPIRARVMAALGRRAGLVAAVLPEFAALLQVEPGGGGTDPGEARSLLRQAHLDLLCAVAAPDRPLAVILDDLQWAGPATLDFVDDVVTGQCPAGVLLVGTYRDSAVDAAHPLSGLLARWRRTAAPPLEVRLTNLPPTDAEALIGEMLRQPPSDVVSLADAVRRHTDGNPFDTVEFLNMLRDEDILRLTDEGWTWDTDGLDRPIAQGDVLSLLTARISALPAATRDLLQVMACLGGEVDLDLLARLEFGDDRDAIRDRVLAEALAPALEKGLLVIGDDAAPAVRFRHDRIHQAAYHGMAPAARAHRRLALARRLCVLADNAMAAAEQYLPVVDELTDPSERGTVVLLFRDAARQTRLRGNPVLTERLLAAAAALLDAGATVFERPVIAQALRRSVIVDWHAALFALARFEEQDRLYERLSREHGDPVELAEAACVQIRSLTNRKRPQDALALGLEMLAALGYATPEEGTLAAETERGLDALGEWIGTGSEADDIRRGTNQDARLTAAARVIHRTIPPAFFTGAPVSAWLITLAARVWAEGGPDPALVGPLVRAAMATIPLREDHRAGYQAARRALATGEALGYDVAYERYLYALAAGSWFEPLEAAVAQARRAREELLRTGRGNDASYTYYVSGCVLLECAGGLEEFLDEVESGLALTGRTGNHQVAAVLKPYRQAVRALQGETRTAGGLDDDGFDEREHLDAHSGNLTAAGHFHTVRALTAAVFGDQAALLAHTEAAMSVIRAVQGTQVATRARLLRALALAQQMQRNAVTDDLLAEFDGHRGWMERRATEFPITFRHLSAWLQAERAWLVGDVLGADLAFDRAQHEAGAGRRAWQQALIAERRAAFSRARGLDHACFLALREAQEAYRSWGAGAKVEQLDAAHPRLRATGGRPGAIAGSGSVAGWRSVAGAGSSGISSDAIDMLAVVRASQALSSQTRLTGLLDQVVDVVGALTGATDVRLVLRDADRGRWVLPCGHRCDGTGPGTGPEGEGPAQERDRQADLSPEEASAGGLLPLSVFRYVERTRQTLLVEDVTRDGRFAGDPCLRGLGDCSLLAMPILARGEPSAILILLNRHGRGAFSTDRAEIVQLLAGQLSVSLENARLYAALEQRVAERTQALTAANQQLEQLAVTDPLTGLPNRRRLAETLGATWQRAARQVSSLALAMIDIDEFKQYNDHYGHPAGDRCLTRVASAISSRLRVGDVVARYGGEEFCVVLADCDLATAESVAERIRAGVEALDEPHEPAAHGRVTVSVGVAALVPGPGRSAEDLVASADAQLYRAKNAGRNRVSGPGGGTPDPSDDPRSPGGSDLPEPPRAQA